LKEEVAVCGELPSEGAVDLSVTRTVEGRMMAIVGSWTGVRY